MSVRWLSINDVKRLVQEKMYALENGTVFDRRGGNTVGKISGNSFTQDSDYQIPPYIIQRLETFSDDDWDKDCHDW